MVKFVLTDPESGAVLARCMADEKSFEAWPKDKADKLPVSDEVFNDEPEAKYAAVKSVRGENVLKRKEEIPTPEPEPKDEPPPDPEPKGDETEGEITIEEQKP